jgi:GGDEF domain-containing protein
MFFGGLGEAPLPDLLSRHSQPVAGAANGDADLIPWAIRKPFLIDTYQLVVTTSIGIAVYPNDGIGEGILLKNADIAMYQAKQAGGGGRNQLRKKV